MINLAMILKDLGPGYWLEIRYHDAGLDVQFHFRIRDKELMIKSGIRITDEVLTHSPESVMRVIKDKAWHFEKLVNAKIKQ
jgi:hypothetical protein